MACCYSLQKKSQAAIKALEKAIKIEPEETIENMKQDEDFSDLQDKPEFQQLIASGLSE